MLKDDDMKKKLIIIISIIVAVIVGILIGISYFTEELNTNASGAIISEGIIPGYTAEQIQEMMQREADKSTFSFEVNARPFFENSSSEGNFRIANPPYNAYAIEVEIKLDENQKTVFKTGKLAPNHYIEKAKMFIELPAGEYPATATINAYSTETNEFIGTSSARLIITVNN